MPRTSARRITGRHPFLDGAGAIIELHDAPARTVEARLIAGLRRLGWPGEPQIRPHGNGVSVGVLAPPDLLRIAVDLVEWARDDGDSEELDRIVARAERRADPDLRAILQAFPDRAFAGEDLLTVGLGRHARSWPLDALPAVESLGTPQRVPVAMITGTNGKTTTTRLLAHLAMEAGVTPGWTSSGGVLIGDQMVERGDWTGPGAARRALRDPRTAVAILETARGGILRRGLAVEGADVAVLTNVTPDHLGEWGVDSLEDMARVKLTIAAALRPGGTLILPAAAPAAAPIYAALPALLRRRPDLRLQTFSGHSPQADGWADDRWMHVGDSRVPLTEIPCTFDGTARHNVENALAATLAALALGLPGAAISRGLRSFRPSLKDNPGRMNTFRLPSGAVVVVDVAHTSDGLHRIAETLRRWPQPRRTVLLGQTGDRPDADVRDLALAALELQPHRIVLKEMPTKLYDRRPMEVPAIMRAALLSAGYPADRLVGPSPDEEAGVRWAIQGAGREDAVLLLCHETLVGTVRIVQEAGGE